MIDEVMVSIICNAYNHERYIRKALDSFVNQKTDFKFEILVHDDASTDKTADIIREYEMKYPDIIKPIYQTENQHSKAPGTVGKLQAARAIGKYIALCEGDDYWSDPLKLQKQFDALENNSSCHFCVCGTEVINEDDVLAGWSYPKTPVKEGIISSAEFMDITVVYNFQTSSYFARASFFKEFFGNPPTFKIISDVGDVPLLLYFGYIGNVYYIDEKMSCYRINSISSWNRNEHNNMEKIIRHNEIKAKMLEEFDKFSNYLYHDSIDKRLGTIKCSVEIAKGNYKEILKKENRKYFRLFPKRERLKIYLRGIAPGLYPLIYGFYKKLRK